MLASSSVPALRPPTFLRKDVEIRVGPIARVFRVLGVAGEIGGALTSDSFAHVVPSSSLLYTGSV